MTKVSLHWEKSIKDLFAEAVIKALEDAGNPKVDAIYVGNMAAEEFTNQKNLAPLVSDFAGLEGVPAIRIENGGASGGSALIEGYNAVASGVYDAVIVSGVEKMSETVSSVTEGILSMVTDSEYEAFHGLSLAGAAAMIMRLYMNKFNVNREDLSQIIVKMHENAALNPYAQLPFKVSIDTILNARVIADPITLMDCSPISDGAAAVVLCAADKAKKLTDTLIEIAGIAQATDTPRLHERDDLLTLNAVKRAAEKAYNMAKIRPKDLDVTEIADSYSILGILSIEDLKLAEKGKGYQIFEANNIAINPSGGLKARGNPIGATGVYQAAEVVLQLRGEAGKMQVENAEIGLTQDLSGMGTASTVTVFRRQT